MPSFWDCIRASEFASGPMLDGLKRIYDRALAVPIPEDVTRGTIEPTRTRELL